MTTTDSSADSDSDMVPDLIHTSAESDSDFEVEEEENRLAQNNEEAAKKWWEKNESFKTEQHKIVKYYALGPFIFGYIGQDGETWINLAKFSGLLKNQTFDTTPLDDITLAIVELLESAIDVVGKALLKASKAMIKEVLDLVDKIAKHKAKFEHNMDEIIRMSSGQSIIKQWRPHVTCDEDITNREDKIVVALLFTCQQYALHICQYTKKGKNLHEQYEKEIKNEAKNEKELGNIEYNKGNFSKAGTLYTTGLSTSPFNLLLYSNRAQAYYKSGNLRGTLSDGKRCIVLNPYWAKGHIRYAQALLDMDKYKTVKKARDSLVKAREIIDKKDASLENLYHKAEERLQQKRAEIPEPEIPEEQQSDPDPSSDQAPPLTSDESELEDSDCEADDECPNLVTSSDEDSTPTVNQAPRKSSSASSNNVNTLDDDDGPPALQSDSDDDVRFYESQASCSSQPAHKRNNMKKNGDNVKKQLEKKKERERIERERRERQEREKRERELAQQLNRNTKELKKKNKEMNNNTKAAPKSPVSREKIQMTERQRDLESNMRQGSEALRARQCRNALWYYQKSIEMVNEYTIEYFAKSKRFGEVEYVVLLFSIGTACIETGMQKEINEGIVWLTRIVEEHQSVRFPLAYLGLGKAYHKQNRFKEALVPLEKGDFIVSGGKFNINLYTFPGTKDTIEESRPEILKPLFREYITYCKYPPAPDAICKHADCSKHFSRNIYLCDPDFKGYVRVFCYFKCVIEFHIDCWKRLKSKDKEKLSDRDIANKFSCFTPDCAACVITVRIYDHDGQILKEIQREGDIESLKKSEPRKHVKMKPISARAIERKQKQKEERKRRKGMKYRGSTESLNSLQGIITPPRPTENKENIETGNVIGGTAYAQNPSGPTELDLIPNNVNLDKLYAKIHQKGSASPEQMYKSKVVPKAKKKKRKEQKSNAMSLGEFVSHGDAEETSSTDTTPSVSSTDLSASNRFSSLDPDKPFSVPPNIQRDVREFEGLRMGNVTKIGGKFQITLAKPVRAVSPRSEESVPVAQGARAVSPRPVNYASAAKKASTQASGTSEKGSELDIKDGIFCLFSDVLGQGPLNINDKKIQDELDAFPEEAKTLVQNAGGIAKFLSGSLQFFNLDNYVCLMQDSQKAIELAKKETQKLLSEFRSPRTGNPISERVTKPTLNETNFPIIGLRGRSSGSQGSGSERFSSPGNPSPSNNQGAPSLDFKTIASDIIAPKETLRDSLCNGVAETTPTSSPGRPIPSLSSESATLATSGLGTSQSGSSVASQTGMSLKFNSSAPMFEATPISSWSFAEKNNSTEQNSVQSNVEEPEQPKVSVSELFRKQVFEAAGKDPDAPLRAASPASVSSLGSCAEAGESQEGGTDAEGFKVCTVKPEVSRTAFNTGEKDVRKFRLEARNVSKHLAPVSKPVKSITVTASSHSTPSRSPPIASPLPKKSESVPSTPARQHEDQAVEKQREQIDRTKELWHAAGDAGPSWQASIRPWGQEIKTRFSPPEQYEKGGDFVDIGRRDEKGESPETLAQTGAPWGAGRSPSLTPPREGNIWSPYNVSTRKSASPAPPGIPAPLDKTMAPPVDMNVMPSIHSSQSPLLPPAPSMQSGLLGGKIELNQENDQDTEPWTMDSDASEDSFVEDATGDVKESAQLEMERLDNEFCREQANSIIASLKDYPDFAQTPGLLDKILVQVRSDVEKSQAATNNRTPKKVTQPIGTQVGGRGKIKKKNMAVNCDIRAVTYDVGINTDPYETYREPYLLLKDQMGLLQIRLQEAMDKNVQVGNRKNAEIMTLAKERDEMAGKLHKFEEFSNTIAKDYEAESKKWALEKKRLSEETKTARLQMKAFEQSAGIAAKRTESVERQLVEVADHLNQEREQALQERQEMRMQIEHLEQRVSGESCRAQDSEIALLQLKLDFGLQILEKNLKDADMYAKHFGNQVSKLRNDKKPIPPVLHEIFTKWIVTVEEIKKRQIKAKEDFRGYIQRVRQGESLSSLGDIPIPKPPAPPTPEQLAPPPPQLMRGPAPNIVRPPGFVGQLPPPAGMMPPNTSAPAAVPPGLFSIPPPTHGGPSGAGIGFGAEPVRSMPSPVKAPVSRAPGLGEDLLSDFKAAMSQAQESERFQGALPGSPKKVKTSFDKIITNLCHMFPNYNRNEITNFIQDFRRSNQNSLTGLSLSQIVQKVAELILQQQARPGAGLRNPSGQIPAGEEVFQEEEDPCIICHEDFPQNGAGDKQWRCHSCGNRYHTQCIRQWLKEQSTCPTCRKHVLLQDEYPALG